MCSNSVLSSRNRAATALGFVMLCMNRCKLLLLLEVRAFTPLPLENTCIACRYRHRCTNEIALLHASIDDDSENDTSYDDDENDALLNELRDKKKEAFGADIPSNEELQQAAKNAENAFLAAMLEQTQKFKEIKTEKGGDAAGSEFTRRIQEEEAQRLEDADAASKVSGEESMDAKLLVQQMEKGITEDSEEEEDRRRSP